MQKKFYGKLLIMIIKHHDFVELDNVNGTFGNWR